jgi:hypothetical protein
VRDRVHWVLAEATATAAMLGDEERYREWWSYAAEDLIDSGAAAGDTISTRATGRPTRSGPASRTPITRFRPP